MGSELTMQNSMHTLTPLYPMKKSMTIALALLLAGSPLMMAEADADKKMSKADKMEKKEGKYRAEASGDLSKAEVKFVMKAAKANQAEITKGQLASTAATTDDLKGFGKMMVDDHTAAKEKLAAIADKNGVKLADLGDKHKDHLTELSRVKGEEFDREFMAQMKKDHEMSIKLFKDAQGTVKNEELKDFVDNTLPTLEKHLDELNELMGERKEDGKPVPAQS